MNKDRFKFRVWSVAEKTYDHKFPFNSLGIFYIAETGRLFSDFGNSVAPEIHEDRFVVEQCTGLKDKNGNLIYEGDKVEITIFGSIGTNGGYVDSDEIYKGTVVWNRDCFLVKTDTDDMILFPHSEDCIEIISNIHEQKDK